MTDLNIYYQESNARYSCHKLRTTIIDSNRNYSWIDKLTFDSTQLTDITNALTKKPDTKNIILTVAYYDEIFSDGDTLKKENLKGLSIYSLQNSSYYYQLFANHNNELEEITKLSGKTYVISTSTIKSIGAEVLFKNKQNYSCVLLSRNSYTNKKEIVGSDLLQQRLEKYLSTNN